MPSSIVGSNNGRVLRLHGALAALLVISGCVEREELPIESDDPSPATDAAIERDADAPDAAPPPSAAVPPPSAAAPPPSAAAAAPAKTATPSLGASSALEMPPPPQTVSWERPAADAVLGARETRIEGTAPPGARIRMGDGPWVYIASTRFSLPVQLTEGDNRLVLEAIWKGGGARFERHVYYVDAVVIETLQLVADTQRRELADIEAQSRELSDEIELIGGIFPVLPPASRNEAELLARELSAQVEDIVEGCADLTDDVEQASADMADLREGLRASPP